MKCPKCGSEMEEFLRCLVCTNPECGYEEKPEVKCPKCKKEMKFLRFFIDQKGNEIPYEAPILHCFGCGHEEKVEGEKEKRERLRKSMDECMGDDA